MTDTKASQETGSEVEKTRPMLDPTALRSLQNFEDALAYAEETHGELIDASTEIGDGFTLLEDKDDLLKTPFVALGWNFSKGDFGADFLTMRVVTDAGGKLVLNDGSTGLCAQVREYEERTGKTGGLFVQRGLRKSHYQRKDEDGNLMVGADGEPLMGTTHYLNV